MNSFLLNSGPCLQDEEEIQNSALTGPAPLLDQREAPRVTSGDELHEALWEASRYKKQKTIMDPQWPSVPSKLLKQDLA